MAAAGLAVGAAQKGKSLLEQKIAEFQESMRQPTLDRLDDLSRKLTNYGMLFAVAGVVAWFVGNWGEKAATAAATDEANRLNGILAQFGNAKKAASAGTWYEPWTWGNYATAAVDGVADLPTAVFAGLTAFPHVAYDGFIYTGGSIVGGVLLDVAPFLLLVGVIMLIAGFALSETGPSILLRLKASSLGLRSRAMSRELTQDVVAVDARNAEDSAIRSALAGSPAPPPPVIDAGRPAEPRQSEPESVGGAVTPTPTLRPTPEPEPPPPVQPTPTLETERMLGEPDALEPTAEEIREMERSRRETLDEDEPEPEPDVPPEPTGYDRMLEANDAFAEAESVPVGP